jgi:hypothetical protein
MGKNIAHKNASARQNQDFIPDRIINRQRGDKIFATKAKKLQQLKYNIIIDLLSIYDLS